MKMGTVFIAQFSYGQQRHRDCVHFSNMIRHWSKPLGVLLLTILLAYSGAAWALSSCLNDGGSLHSHDDHASHEAFGNTRILDADRSPGSNFPANETIHCTDFHETHLAATLVSVFRLIRFADKAFPSANLSDGVLTPIRERAWVRSSFWRIVLSESVGFNPHIISVLRI